MKILFWPFLMIWAFIGFLFSMMGRLLTAVVGIVLMIAGFLLTLTIVAAIIGIPLVIAGFLLLLRAMF